MDGTVTPHPHWLGEPRDAETEEEREESVRIE